MCAAEPPRRVCPQLRRLAAVCATACSETLLTLEVQIWDQLDRLTRHDKTASREAVTLSCNISTSRWKPGLCVGFPISRALAPSARGRRLLPKAPRPRRRRNESRRFQASACRLKAGPLPPQGPGLPHIQAQAQASLRLGCRHIGKCKT